MKFNFVLCVLTVSLLAVVFFTQRGYADDCGYKSDGKYHCGSNCGYKSDGNYHCGYDCGYKSDGKYHCHGDG